MLCAPDREIAQRYGILCTAQTQHTYSHAVCNACERYCGSVAIVSLRCSVGNLQNSSGQCLLTDSVWSVHI